MAYLKRRLVQDLDSSGEKAILKSGVQAFKLPSGRREKRKWPKLQTPSTVLPGFMIQRTMKITRWKKGTSY